MLSLRRRETTRALIATGRAAVTLVFAGGTRGLIAAQRARHRVVRASAGQSVTVTRASAGGRANLAPVGPVLEQRRNSDRYIQACYGLIRSALAERISRKRRRP
jgi:hypothetical protein